MIDCSNIMNFYNELDRFCKALPDCTICNIGECCPRSHSLCDFNSSEIKEIIENVQYFSDHNPKKTYLDDFCKKFPNSHWENIVHSFCPAAFGYIDCKQCEGYEGVISVQTAICWHKVMKQKCYNETFMTGKEVKK